MSAETKQIISEGIRKIDDMPPMRPAQVGRTQKEPTTPPVAFRYANGTPCVANEADESDERENEATDASRDTEYDHEHLVAILARRGYRLLHKLCDSQQGHVFVAEALRSRDGKAASRFVIKRLDKALCDQHETREDEFGTTQVVDEDVRKEAAILRHLTLRNKAAGAHIAKFVEFFESSTHCYLVTRQVPGVTLGELTNQAHAHIQSGKMSRKHWLKAVKFIMWQLTGALHWLHKVYACCHLDVCAENIMVTNAAFDAQPDGSVVPSQRLVVSLIDFGVAELFDGAAFDCFKDQLSVDHGAYVAPQVFANQVYDARKADTWALGMVLYRLATNEAPYAVEDIWTEDAGYAALKAGRFSKWLRVSHLEKTFGKNAASLLVDLLSFDEDERPLAGQAMKAKWFKSYWQRYGEQIALQMARDAAQMERSL